MFDDKFRIAMGDANKKLVGNLKKNSLELTVKWHAIRESEDLGKRYRLRPRLTGDYSKGVT